MAKLRVGFSQTINLGNYESIKPMVELEDDLLPDETVHDAYLRIHGDLEPLFEKEVVNQVLMFKKVKKLVT